MDKKIKLEDFFEFGENKPIQRLSYSKEDVKYKVKIMKKMQELGMKVKVDRIGNICATLEGNGKSNKSILIGSHTDSVKDGGQYDGPAGVVSGLKVVENVVEKIEKGEMDLDCDLKVVVWACEESARFGKACLGSKWIEGTLKEEEFSIKETMDKQEEDKKTLEEAIKEYMDNIQKSEIKDIEYVDKIISMKEILTAYELHIEQYQYLLENDIDIGAISSITAPYRMKIEIDGKEKVLDAAELVVKLNERAKEAEKPENGERYRATVPVINIMQERAKEPDILINIDLLGNADHSGATPMGKRKDSVLAASKYILTMNEILKECNYDEFFKVHFNSICTANDSMNKIAPEANIVLGIDANGYSKEVILKALSDIDKKVTQIEGITTNFREIDGNKMNAKETLNNLKIDIRMQTSTNAKEMLNEISDMVIGIAEETENTYICNKTDKGEPTKTSEKLMKQLHESCKENNLKSTTMKSWAGHDLAHIGILDKILIFIKSTGGSHNPFENTTREELEKGITALTGTVLKDIRKVNEVVKEIEDLGEYSTVESDKNIDEEESKKIIKNELVNISKYGINVSNKIKNKLKREIISYRYTDVEK